MRYHKEPLMTTKWTARLREFVSAHWKRILSYRKRDWNLCDYPVRVTEQQPEPAYEVQRFKSARYRAAIINWWVMDGLGDTRDQALGNLRDELDKEKIRRAQQGKPLPRPGSDVPLEYASQDCINEHREISEDFIRRVLGLEWAWISDESSLWHFHHDKSNDLLLDKIKRIYGVDVSDVESANISEILRRIAASQSHG